jgi:ligand-binding sensor domain-containing protein
MKKFVCLFALVLFGLSSYSQFDNIFTYVSALPSDKVKSVLEVESLNEIWVGTYEGIARFDGTNWSQEIILGGAVDLNAHEMIEASDGSVWVALGNGGVSKYESGGWTNYTMSDGLASNSNWSIAEDSSGNIWVGSTDAGISVFDGTDWTVMTTDNGLAGNSVVEILTTFRGDVWFGTANGVSIYDGTEFSNLTTSDGLPSQLIKAFYQDFNGNVCVATSNGIGMYNGAEWIYLSSTDGLPTNNILDIAQMQNGDFLFASDLGLIHYDGTNFTLLNYDDGLVDNVVRSITVDSEGQIWVCTPFSGLSVVDTENSYLNVRENLNLVNSKVKCLHAENSQIYIGTTAGASMFDGEIWRTHTIESLVADTVLDIAVEGDTIYFACIGGLSIFNSTDLSYENLTVSDGLTADTIMSVEVMNDGTIYLGTYYGMIEILTDGTINNYTTADGLANDTVWVVLKDNTGNLWAGTKNGLSKFSSGSFTNYDDSDIGGLDVRDLIIDHSGVLWAASAGFLAYYSAGTWSHYTNTETSLPIVDMMESGAYIYLLNTLGTISYYDRSGGAFSSTSMTHYTALEILDNAYWYLGRINGLYQLSLSIEDDNTLSINYPTCPNSINASIIIDENSDNPPYLYSIDNGQTYQTDNEFTSLIPGQYCIKVKNTHGHFTKDTSVFLAPQQYVDAVIDLEQIDCNGNSNGIVELFRGDATYTFNWADSGTGVLRENLTADTYTVTVSDGTCSVVRENTIVEPDEILLDATKIDVLCHGENTGEIDLSISGGTPPYEITWSNSSQTEDIQDLIADEYSVTVTDVNGCTAELSETITEPTQALQIDYTQSNISCFGLSNGEIQLSITGGTLDYTIEWNDASDLLHRTALDAAEYTVTVTDNNACTVSEQITITEPDEIEFTQINVTQISCFGDNDGAITIITEGGTGTHTYSWTMNGNPDIISTSASLTDLSVGEYTVTVMDENSCTIENSVDLVAPSSMSLDFDLTPITCHSYNDGQITVVPEGGTSPYIYYYWSYEDNPNIIAVTQTIEDCQPGIYHVSVADAHSCEIVGSIEMLEPDEHTVELNVTQMPCHGSETAQIEVVVDGGATTDLDYVWSNGAGNVSVAQNLGADSYSVTIVDANGCEIVEETEIIEPPLEDLGVFDDSGVGFLCDGSSVTLDAGVGYLSYLWSNGSDQQSIEVDEEGTYSVFVVDNDGCDFGDTISLELSTPFQNEEICFVTVDDENHFNVIWNKTANVGTSSYNVYRKQLGSSNYNLIGTVPFSAPAIFVDEESDATVNDEFYKIAALDTCGGESALSEMHSGITLNVDSDIHGACYLNWDSYEGYFVVYYFIMRGDSPDNLQVVDSVLYNDFDFAELNPNDEGVFYQIMVRRPDVCSPGNGDNYGYAYSNIVYCDNITGMVQLPYGNIDVYPNPFVNYVKIILDLNIQRKFDVCIFNSLGQRVYDSTEIRESGKSEMHIPLENIPQGLYNLQLHFGDHIWHQKIVRQ